ncbi:MULTISPECIES: hypothetical protein [unclassified Streptomyces]|uniref:hypothetical protein n=1 Tax=unclassified Streptomyces TaxID=2593676 RepID=UPI002E30A871|nr:MULTISPECIES: hypothetical protein [unclassified Streptomyces]WUC63098.1 hypothetical protein OG861_02120 [Streptomyces sp. NBC_00539]
MTKNSNRHKHPVAAALIPLFVVAGLLLGPAAVATAAVPTARQAPAAAALAQRGLPAGANVATALHAAPTSTQAKAVTGNKKSKKSKKKKGGLFKKLLIVVVIVVVLLVVLYGVRRALRRRSA